jgi:hypothetical protein
VNFSSSDDEDDQVEEVEPDDSFVCELDQLSLSDADLQTLEPEEISEYGTGKTEAKDKPTSIDESLNKSFLSRLTSVRASSKNFTKRHKTVHLAPITFGRLQTTLGKPKTTGIRILFDSGSTKTHVKRDCVKKLRLRKDVATTWNTAVGTISTNEKCKALFSLPEFSPTKMIEWEIHIGTLENTSL